MKVWKFEMTIDDTVSYKYFLNKPTTDDIEKYITGLNINDKNIFFTLTDIEIIIN